jgi:hypothetical protein
LVLKDVVPSATALPSCTTSPSAREEQLYLAELAMTQVLTGLVNRRASSGLTVKDGIRLQNVDLLAILQPMLLCGLCAKVFAL